MDLSGTSALLPVGGGGLGGSRQRRSSSDDRMGGLRWEAVKAAAWSDSFGGGFSGDGAAAWVTKACLEVLERLLTVGLSDEAASVRREVVVGLEVSKSRVR